MKFISERLMRSTKDLYLTDLESLFLGLILSPTPSPTPNPTRIKQHIMIPIIGLFDLNRLCLASVDRPTVSFSSHVGSGGLFALVKTGSKPSAKHVWMG